MRKALSALALILAAPLAHAADVSLGLSNKTISVDLTSPPVGSGLVMTAGYLHHADNGNVGSVGLQVSQKIQPGLEAGLGGKLIFVENDIRNAWALALGGQIDWAFPTVPALHLGAHGWYSPNVTTYHDTKNIYDIGTSVSYRLLTNGEVFLAWRRIHVDYEVQRDKAIQSGPLIGMKLIF